MAMDGDSVWVASGPHIIKYLRGKEVCYSFSTFFSPTLYRVSKQILRATNPFTTNLCFITIFGSQLLSLTEDGNRMLVWKTDSGGT